jgi:hypothetical protein
MERIIRFAGLAFVFLLLVLGSCIFFANPRRPKESKIIQNFKQHRAEFEKLRDMLQADTNVSVVAKWGVRSQTFPLSSANVISNDRYTNYLALLKSAGGDLATRDEGEPAQPGILIWSTGFAGNTEHIGICWMTNAPTTLITSLDQHFKTHTDPPPVYQHIDQNWYIWADW